MIDQNNYQHLLNMMKFIKQLEFQANKINFRLPKYFSYQEKSFFLSVLSIFGMHGELLGNWN